VKVELIGLDELLVHERSPVVAIIDRVLAAADLYDYGINVSLVGQDAMKDLYFRFKKKKKITDVLSFPTPDMERLFAHTKHFLGDVVICTDKARSQAKEFGHGFVDEIAVLCAHGLFHLLGYDHEISEEDANIQLQGEMYLLEKAGLSPELSLIGRS